MKLASIFTDHAVMQRGMTLPVWGWTTPKARVRAVLNGQTADGMAGADGAFMLRLPAMEAGGPYELEITTPDPGEGARCKDVWVGEVWICSGQSNMQWTVANSSPVESQGPCDAVRMITVPNVADAGGRKTSFNAAWQVATPATVNDFSAVGMNFAWKLHRELGVAVGMVNTSWGGTRIEAWMSREALARVPHGRETLGAYDALVNSGAHWDGIDPFDPTAPGMRDQLKLAKMSIPPEPGRAPETAGWEAPGFDDNGWENMALPSTWQGRGHRYSGTLWFRKTVDIPAAWAGRDVLLGIGAADKHDTTFFNGERVGGMGEKFEENFWNVPREYRVPGRLVKAGRAVVASRVHSFLFDGGLIGPANLMRLRLADDPAQSIPLAGGWLFKCEANYGFRQPPEMQLAGPGDPNSPAVLFENMVWPLVPYALRGAVWYQGESNAGPATSRIYGELLRGMANDWRYHWGQGDFPLLAVQLANYTPARDFDAGAQWPFVREGIADWARQPGGGMAVIIDIGDAVDIHPKNKRDVGFRLALWALANTYGRPVVSSGPLYRGMAHEAGGKIRLFFDHAGAGLTAKGGMLKTFVIADAGRSFEPAEAVIDGDTVVVWREGVANPLAVRYAWADNPEACNLFNLDGLPASPFRTDAW
ncbi:MAG: 9-O-acetylesterase [Kiritimatiellaeota bacterium]|nr:9-O-acetylesterase [Kiritimatiellota bacterium]